MTRHSFGGEWTEAKLSVLSDYLRAYTTALKNQPFTREYIDAFAGTGYRDIDGELPLFAGEPQASRLSGSARRALETKPAFDRYVFIESKPAFVEELARLPLEFPHLASRIEIRQMDANVALRQECRDADWASRRAVVFVDPYDTELDWATIAAVAATRSIDLWVLFPLGAGNRLLKNDGNVPDDWRKCLNRLLGTEDWYEAVYQRQRVATLFGTEEDRLVKQPADALGRFFVSRLAQVFAWAEPKPLILCNSKNSPLFMLCFAIGNPRGVPLAKKLVEGVLRPKGKRSR